MIEPWLKKSAQRKATYNAAAAAAPENKSLLRFTTSDQSVAYGLRTGCAPIRELELPTGGATDRNSGPLVSKVHHGVTKEQEALWLDSYHRFPRYEQGRTQHPEQEQD